MPPTRRRRHGPCPTRINAIRGIVSSMVRGEKGAAARLHGEVTALLEEMYFSREAPRAPH